jgi:hypothetical protein
MSIDRVKKLEMVAKHADEVLAEREAVRTPAEARLMLALYALDPNSIHGKDNCTCGESEDCDACETVASTVAWLRRRSAERDDQQTIINK